MLIPTPTCLTVLLGRPGGIQTLDRLERYQSENNRLHASRFSLRKLFTDEVGKYKEGEARLSSILRNFL